MLPDLSGKCLAAAGRGVSLRVSAGAFSKSSSKYSGRIPLALAGGGMPAPIVKVKACEHSKIRAFRACCESFVFHTVY